MALTKRQRYVLIRRLRGDTFKVIAGPLEVSGWRVAQIYEKAVQELIRELIEQEKPSPNPPHA